MIFTVTDSGPGIPPDVKDKVFDWFESHSNGSRHRGAGLGLSLVKLLCRTARRQGARRFDRRQRHDRHVRLSDRSGRASQRRGMTDPTTFSLALANETATAHLMADLALLIGPGDVITLSGDLGAGKTAAARAMIRYLAGDDTVEVPSPTFTLAQTYDLPPFPLVHADLYRVNDPLELEEIGLSPLARRHRGADRMAGARARRASRRPHRYRAEPSPGAGIGRARRRDHRLRQSRRAGRTTEGAAAISRRAGYADARRQRMAGDASTRSYARLIRDDGVVILMNSPRRPDGPAIYDGKSYSAAVHLAEDVKPFVAIANGLRERGFSAPVDPSRRPRRGIPDHRGFRQRRLYRRRSAVADRGALSGRDRHAGGAASRTACRKSCRWRRRPATPFRPSTPTPCWSRSD